jgi:hypothetical protein
MEEKKPPAEEMLKDGLLLQEIKGLKEEMNSLKLRMRNLEESSMLEINGLKKEISGLYLINEGLKDQLKSKKI